MKNKHNGMNIYFKNLLLEINKQFGFCYDMMDLQKIEKSYYYEIGIYDINDNDNEIVKIDKNEKPKKCFCFDIIMCDGEMFCYYPSFYGKEQIVYVKNIDETGEN